MESEKQPNEDTLITDPDMEGPGNMIIPDKSKISEPQAGPAGNDSKLESEKQPNEDTLITDPDIEGSGNTNPPDKNETLEPQTGTMGDDSKQTSTEVRENHFFSWFGIIVNLATVVTAIVALLTLFEMKIERNNAYKPDIVIAPDAFEGRKVGSDELEIEKLYIYIDYDGKSPVDWYSGDSMDNGFTQHNSGNRYWMFHPNLNDQSLVYLEAPYLTLKNIGKGTAKNVKLTFSTDWVEEMVVLLNDNPSDTHQYYIETVDSSLSTVNFEDNGHPISIAYIMELSKSISYISSDEESIRIALPEGMYELFAALFAQTVQSRDDTRGLIHVRRIEMPDLKVTIQYTDIQGVTYKSEEVIPWDTYYSVSMMAKKSENDDGKMVRLWTSFYDSYVR